MVAPSPAGPPPTTSTSASPPTMARRRGRATRAASSGRFSAGNAHLPAVQQFHGKRVVLPGALLQRGNVLQQPRPERAAPVPALVDVRDEAARINELERRCGHLQIFQEAGDLA